MTCHTTKMKKMTDWQTFGLWWSDARSKSSFKITYPTLCYWPFSSSKLSLYNLLLMWLHSICSQKSAAKISLKLLTWFFGFNFQFWKSRHERGQGNEIVFSRVQIIFGYDVTRWQRGHGNETKLWPVKRCQWADDGQTPTKLSPNLYLLQCLPHLTLNVYIAQANDVNYISPHT